MVSYTQRAKGNRPQLESKLMDKIDDPTVMKIRNCLKDSEKTSRQILRKTHITKSQFKTAILIMSHQDLYEDEETKTFGLIEFCDCY